MLAIFSWNFEFEERCKGVDCVDLGESFPTSIYLMKSASVQPRTSPSKFGGKFNSLFIRVLGLLVDWAKHRLALHSASIHLGWHWPLSLRKMFDQLLMHYLMNLSAKFQKISAAVCRISADFPLLSGKLQQYIKSRYSMKSCYCMEFWKIMMGKLGYNVGEIC